MIQRRIFGAALSAYAIIGFLGAFFGARLFAILNPTVVVVQGQVHFHHFWYGLGMTTLSGWLGIAFNRPRLVRTYALVFGLGAGLIGDEVGLLLTFGNYQSELTGDFLVGAIGFIALVSILLRYQTLFRRDLVHEGWNERLVNVGIVLAGLAAIFFAVKLWTAGIVLAGLGFVIVLAAFEAAKAGVLAGLISGSILALGNFFLLYDTNVVRAVLQQASLPSDTGSGLDQLVFLVSVSAAVLSLVASLLEGALLGILFSKVRNRYLKSSSLRNKGLVFGLGSWVITSLLGVTSLEYGILVLAASIMLGLFASLVYGYLLGTFFERFRRKIPETTATSC